MLSNIDTALQQKRLSEAPRKYLGASSIGFSCSRKIQYAYRNTEPDEPIEARTLRIFDRGHVMEDYVASLLRLAGFKLTTMDAHGKQLGFKCTEYYGTFAGHVDGIITDGPDRELAYPLLWEHKTVGAKSFAKHKNASVATANEVYATQIAVYQQQLQLHNPALFTVLNADTMELHYELVPYDSKIATAANNKAKYILECPDNELMPRVSNKADYWECRWCEFKERCWNEK